MAQQTWQLNSEERWFKELEKGTQKTVEGRLTMPRVQVGDLIEFCWKDRYVVKQVTFVHGYSCFAEMLDVEGVEKIMPGINTMAEAAQIFKEWYPLKQQREKRVMAFGLANVTSSAR